jgi:FkbM family methyltransferase
MDIKSHLTQLSNQNNLPPSHIQYLQKLKYDGFNPNVIYDIGSCVLNWTKEAKKIWPHSTFILFDGFSDAEFLYKNYLYSICILSDKPKTIRWYENSYYPTGNSYYRENNSNIFPENKYIEKMTTTLDDIVALKNYPLPDLVKIDVQGSEKDIITGGKNTLKNSKHLIVEMQHMDYNLGAPKVLETLPFIEMFLECKCVAPLFCNNGVDGDYGFSK